MYVNFVKMDYLFGLKGWPLTDDEIGFVVELVMGWIKEQDVR